MRAQGGTPRGEEPVRAPAAVPEGADGAVQRAAISLLACTDIPELLTSAMDQCLARVRGDTGTLYLLRDDGWLRLAIARGYREELLARFESLDPQTAMPAPRAVRERRPVVVPAEEFRAHHPDLAVFRRPVVFACFPLLVDDGCLGSVVVQVPPGSPSDAERRDLLLLTAVCALRLEHLLAQGKGAGMADDPRLGQAVRQIDSRSRAARLELAMSATEIGFYDWDFDSGRLIWDERLCRIFGQDPETFEERIDAFYRAVYPGDRATIDGALATARETGTFAASYRVVRPDGAVRWVKGEGRVFYDAEGRPRGMLGIVRDRTEEHLRYTRDTARREFLLSVTRAITGALSTQEVVDTAAAMVLPALGATHVTVYVSDSGGLAVAASHGFDERELEALHAQAREVPHDPELLTALERQPLFCETRADYQALYAEQLPRLPGQEAWAILPLVTAEGPVGTCVISFDRPHVFSEDDEALCIAAAGVLAQAVGRARLSDERRHQMTELQRLLLPGRIPELPGLELAVRYLPGAEGLDVGGDWYDVVAAADGHVMFVVGDVQGHSAQAAAVMGHVRVSMHAHAADEWSPAELLARGNRILCEVDTERFATALAVEVSAARDRIRVARAGHACPLLIERSGEVHEVETPGGLPMGCFEDERYPVLERELPPGATLLLYTDGLVEKRGQDIGDSLVALKTDLARWAFTDPGPDGGPPRPRDLHALADRVVASVGRVAVEDDVALLLLRRTSPPEPA
ncbi:hypothetical protein ACZ90_08235 [Streptomyces albus subsp. albus]|nr:hypothetical protein ACZ90_08235 [Streptomyces albus subsp. albus]